MSDQYPPERPHSQQPDHQTPPDHGSAPPPDYGSAPPPPPPMGYPEGYAAPATQRGKGMAVTALVLGILSIVLFFLPPLTIVLGIIAIVLAILAMRKARTGAAAGAGLAKAGLILGIIGVIVALVVFAFSAFLVSKVSDCSKLPTQSQQQQCVKDKLTG